MNLIGSFVSGVRGIARGVSSALGYGSSFGVGPAAAQLSGNPPSNAPAGVALMETSDSHENAAPHLQQPELKADGTHMEDEERAGTATNQQTKAQSLDTGSSSLRKRDRDSGLHDGDVDQQGSDGNSDNAVDESDMSAAKEPVRKRRKAAEDCLAAFAAIRKYDATGYEEKAVTEMPLTDFRAFIELKKMHLRISDTEYDKARIVRRRASTTSIASAPANRANEPWLLSDTFCYREGEIHSFPCMRRPSFLISC